MHLALKIYRYPTPILTNAPLYQNSCDNKTNFNCIRSDFLNGATEGATEHVSGHRLLTRLDVQLFDAHTDHI